MSRDGTITTAATTPMWKKQGMITHRRYSPNDNDPTVNIWQNGAQLDDSFFNGATITWRKYNKLGVLDTSWGTNGAKTGRSLTVTRDEISVAATFIVEISK